MKMMPILFDDNADDYTTQGLGALGDALTCSVTEEINGEYELRMTYPVTGRRYADIKNRCLIYCKPDPYRDAQPFRIYRITRPLNGIVSIYARHKLYDLSGIPVNAFSAQGAAAALAGLKSNAATENPYSFWTNLDNADTAFSVSVPTSTRSLLGGSEGSILDTFGGEYEWDNDTVRLYAHRGSDNGVTIEYGKNLTDIEQDENIASLCTGIIGYWKNGEDAELVQTPVVNGPGEYNFSNIKVVDFTSDFEDQPTVEQLQEHAESYVKDNKVGVPDVSIKLSWIQLEQYSGYEGLSLLDRVSLGDTVTVYFPPLNVEATARVVKTEYDALLDHYITAEIGSVKANIADTIADQQQRIDKVPGTSEIQEIAEHWASIIMGAKGGCVRFLDTDGDGQPDTLYIADNPDPAQAVKVWRFNYEGFAGSSNGYNGPFSVISTFDGMYADFIIAGILKAIQISGVTIEGSTITGTTVRSNSDVGSAYLAEGKLTLYNSDERAILQIGPGATKEESANINFFLPDHGYIGGISVGWDGSFGRFNFNCAENGFVTIQRVQVGEMAVSNEKMYSDGYRALDGNYFLRKNGGTREAWLDRIALNGGTMYDLSWQQIPGTNYYAICHS